MQIVRCLALLLVAGTLVSSCASAAPQWVPRAPADGQCENVASCSGLRAECIEQERSDLLSCYADRASIEANAHGPAGGFDSLAEYLFSKQGHCDVGYAGRQRAYERLLAFYPAVRRDIDRTFRAGQIDLAARRAELVDAAFRETQWEPKTPRPSDSAFITQARDFHDRAAKRLDATLPAAAYFHRCAGIGPDACPSETSPELSNLAALAGIADQESDVRIAASCAKVGAKPLIYPDQHRVGAIGAVHLTVELLGCHEDTPGIENLTVVCVGSVDARGQVDQGHTASAKRITEHIVADAEVRAPRGTTPVHVDVSVRRTEVPEGCTPREALDTTSHAIDTARYQLSSALGTAVSQAIAIEPKDLVDKARERSGSGDLDAADHFFELALIATRGERERSDASQEAHAWFASRYGSRDENEAGSAGFSKSSIGLVFSFPETYGESCYR